MGGPPGARRVPALRCPPVPTGGAAGGGAPASPGTDKGGGTGTGTGRDGPGRAPPALLRRCPARCRRYRAPGGIRGVPGGTWDLQHRGGGCVLPGATCLWRPPAQLRVSGGASRCSGVPGKFGEASTCCLVLYTGGPGGTLRGSRVPPGAGVTEGAPPAPRECQAGQEHPASPRRCCQTGCSWHGYLGTISALPGQRALRYSVPLRAPRFRPGLTPPSLPPEGPGLTHPGTPGSMPSCW